MKKYPITGKNLFLFLVVVIACCCLAAVQKNDIGLGLSLSPTAGVSSEFIITLPIG
jgi:hypothetical protein